MTIINTRGWPNISMVDHQIQYLALSKYWYLSPFLKRIANTLNYF